MTKARLIGARAAVFAKCVPRRFDQFGPLPAAERSVADADHVRGPAGL